MKLTRRRGFFLVLVLALSVAACGDGAVTATTGDETTTTAGGTDTTEPGTDTTEPVTDGVEGTLKVLLHQNPPLVEYMEDFNQRFEAANPGVTVEMEVVPSADIATAAQTRLTAGDVDVIDFCPEGCASFSTPVQDYMEGVEPPLWQQLIDAGLIADLTDEAFVANYDSTALADATTYNGRVYALPAGRVSYSGMFVNNDLLADVGEDLPTTWDELVSTCEAVQATGNECMTVGGADGWPVFVGAYGLLGAYYPDQAALVEGLWTGEIKWDDDDMLDLWSRYETYAQDLLEPGVTGLSHDAGPARFSAGDVAFMPTGVWQAPAVEDSAPAFDWTYVPFPGSNNPEDNQYLFGKYDMSWMVAENAPNKEAALAYLAALSDPDEYQKFVNDVGLIPTQPTATLETTLGQAIAPLLDNYRVGFEQYWLAPTGAGQWANGSQAAAWFQPFNEWDDPDALAQQAQEDLEAGLNS